MRTKYIAGRRTSQVKSELTRSNRPARFTPADAPKYHKGAISRLLRRGWAARANFTLRATGDPDRAIESGNIFVNAHLIAREHKPDISVFCSDNTNNPGLRKINGIANESERIAAIVNGSVPWASAKA